MNMKKFKPTGDHNFKSFVPNKYKERTERADKLSDPELPYYFNPDKISDINNRSELNKTKEINDSSYISLIFILEINYKIKKCLGPFNKYAGTKPSK